MSHREEEEEDQVKGWFYTLKNVLYLRCDVSL